MNEHDYDSIRKNPRRYMGGPYESWEELMERFSWCVEKHHPEQAKELINELASLLGASANLLESQIRGVINEVYNKRSPKASHINGQKANLEYEGLVEFLKKYRCDDIPKELEEEWNKKVYRMKGGIVPSGDG